MTQYPSPYQGPQVQDPTPAGYPYPQGGDPWAAARRAGVMLFVLGGLAMVGGLCCGVGSPRVLDLLMEQPEFAGQLPPEVTPGLMKVVVIIAAGISFVYGAALVVLGYFVRRNAKGAIVIATVLAGLSLAYLALTMLRAIIVGMRQGAGEMVSGLCVVIVPGALFTLLVMWLVQAFRNHGAARAAGDYAGQYWQYAQQQQHAYQQPGWGQVPPPPAPPAVPPIPPAPMPPPPTFGEEGPRGGPDA